MTTTVHDLRAWKAAGRRFTMLTAYDYPTAKILDRAQIPILLVGDTLAQTILGYENTLPVTMEEMLHHTRAVARGAGEAMVVGDMPFMSYQASPDEAIRNAGRFLKEAGAHAVKLEGPMLELVSSLSEKGIPVMGHLGLTPQSVHSMGGYRVQGRTGEAAAQLLDQAAGLEKSGAFAIVLEGVPADLGRSITESLSIPTIGIGAGNGTDGQVLVITDLLGLTDTPHSPKFVKRYADLGSEIESAVRAFSRDVETGAFPDEGHSYR